MPSNAQIRTIQLAQGVAIDPPANVLDDQGEKIFLNNLSSQPIPGLSFDLNVYREIIFDYGIRRRTDSTTGLIEGGRLRFVSNPDGVGADKWIIKTDHKSHEGTSPGVTLSKSVTGDVLDIIGDTTNLAGANHLCVLDWKLTIFLA